MPEILMDSIRADKLLSLARDRFDSTLSPLEIQILKHCAKFDDPQESSPPEDPILRTDVRPAFVRWLTTDSTLDEFIEHRGIRVWGASFDGDVDLRGCRVKHRLEFHSCIFEGEFNCISADIISLYLRKVILRKGFVGSRLTLHGPFFTEGLETAGDLRLSSSHIEAEVLLDGARFTGADALISLTGSHVGGPVSITNVVSTAKVRMLNARFGDDLDFSGSVFSGAGDSIIADGAVVSGDLSFLSGFSSAGSVRLIGGAVGGAIYCSGAKFSSEARALILSGTEVKRHIFLDDGFSSSGGVSLRNVSCGSSIVCSGATMSSSSIALDLEGATVRSNVNLRDGFRATGDVCLVSCTIGGHLDCSDSQFTLLSCAGLKLAGNFLWLGIAEAKKTTLSLAGATINAIHDDRSSWPAKNNLRLFNLIYRDLVLHEPLAGDQRPRKIVGDRLTLSVKDRVEWLNLQADQNDLDPQPWMQLAATLRADGNSTGAKRAIFQFRKRQMRSSKWIMWPFLWLFYRLEEQPLRILIPVILFTAFGSFIFHRAAHEMAPTNREAYFSWSKGGQFESAYPRFNPVIYSLENVLPVVKLGQDDKWAPNPNPKGTDPAISYEYLMALRWILILVGWIQATVLAAAIGSRFKS
jgi:hypothetical protein